MKCTEIGERLLDIVAGMPVEPEVEGHLRTCTACREQLEEWRRTMNLLEEWPAPEPSPYFDTRLGARLREEAASVRRPWWGWVRKPVLAGALAVLLMLGGFLANPFHSLQPPNIAVTAQPGTAVGDLQSLDKNHDLLANFDLLDDLSTDQSQDAGQNR